MTSITATARERHTRRPNVTIDENGDRISVAIFCPVVPRPPFPAAAAVAPCTHPPPPQIVHLHLEEAPTESRSDVGADADACTIAVQSASPPPRTIARLLAAHTPLTPAQIAHLGALGALHARLGAPHARRSQRPARLSVAALHASLPSALHELYVRAHAAPRRHFVRVGRLRVLHVAPSFVAVHKPPGVPACATVDNAVENAVAMAERLLCRRLCSTTRIDCCTSGVVMLAAAAAAGEADDGRAAEEVVSANAAEINAALAEPRAEKMYIAWTTGRAPEVGVLRHWYNNALALRRGPLAGTLLAPWNDGVPPTEGDNGDSGAKWVRAELAVQSVARDESARAWRAVVRLVTGRTHQIRVQFAAVGAPLVGDRKYAPVATGPLFDGRGALGDDPPVVALHAWRLRFWLRGELVGVEAPVELRGGLACSNDELRHLESALSALT